MKNWIKIFKNVLHPAGIIGLVVAVLIPILIYLAPNVGAKDLIRILDQRLPLPLFLIQLCAGIAIFLTLFKDFNAYIKEKSLPRSYFAVVFVAAAIATVAAGSWIEARHRVQSDESIFMSIAQNIHHNSITATCDEGEFDLQSKALDCYKNTDSFKTKGLSFLYSFGMSILGNDLHWIFHVQLGMLFFSALLLFFAIRAWTSDDMLSALSSIILLAQPTILFQYRSMSVEPLYIFLSALSLWTLRWAFDRNTVRHWILCALVLAFFAQTRQETVFCFLAFLIVAIPKILDKKDAKAPAFFVTLSLFSVPILLTISYFQGYGFQGGTHSAHGHFFENLLVNWDVMTKPLTENKLLANPFLSSFNYLFLLGLAFLLFAVFRELYEKRFGRYAKIAGFLLLYHIQTYMILENVSGDFTIEINQRYALVVMPTMAFLAAFALCQLKNIAFFLLGKPSLSSNFTLNLFLTILISAIFFGNTARYKQSLIENIMYNRNHLTTEEAEIWKWLDKQPQKPRLFIYGRPWHFIGYGESSIHYNRARGLSEDSLRSLLQKYDGEVYYIRGLDCWDSKTYHKKAVEHRIPTTCDIFEREQDLEDVHRTLITNNYWLRIAKILDRRNYDPENLFAFGFWQGDADSETFIFNHAEKSNSSGPWKLRVFLNGDSIFAKPYEAGYYSDTLKGPVLRPGYNRLLAEIYDSTSNELIAKVEDYRFFRLQGALQLSLLKPSEAVQDWGDFHVNSSVDGNAFTVAGKKYPEGFGTHASSRTVFDIRGEFSRLTALVGLDEESLCSDGFSYKVLGDGKLLYQSKTVSYPKPDSLDISVAGIRNLVFETDPHSSKDCDHVDILLPTLYPTSKQNPR